MTAIQREVLTIMRLRNAQVRRVPVNRFGGRCEFVPVELDQQWREAYNGPVRANTMRALVEARVVRLRTTPDGWFEWSAI